MARTRSIGAVGAKRIGVVGCLGLLVEAENDEAAAVIGQGRDVAGEFSPVFGMVQVAPAFVVDFERAARRLDQILDVAGGGGMKDRIFGAGLEGVQREDVIGWERWR